MSEFLPMNAGELRAAYGTDTPDFVLVTGDAYVDHPSFGAAIIGRLLESLGYSVGVIAQPDWNDLRSFQVFGPPRLAFLVTAGNIDSMVNRYSVAKKPREKDAYSPGGAAGKRPERAAIVYGNKIRQCYAGAAIILGGLEASLRRLSHYDYWSDAVRRSILLDSAADLLVYGMGEGPIAQIAAALAAGTPVSEITGVRGTVYRAKDMAKAGKYIPLPPYEFARKDRRAYAESFRVQYENTDHAKGRALAEPYKDCWVVQNPPGAPLSAAALDAVYELPYAGRAHPVYDDAGGVPAEREVRFSLVSSRGCFGGCSFCALGFHQGRVVQARSHASVLREAGKLTRAADFKGYIHDVGGPTANFRAPACDRQLESGCCANRQCLFPKPCPKLNTSHADYAALLRKLRALPGVKKVFVRSGVRFDYLMLDNNGAFLEELCQHHVSGQLKVAPEHVSARVLEMMGKPGGAVYKAFAEKFAAVNKRLGLKQFLVPYFMSSHPGSDLAAAVELAEYLRDAGVMPEQVQDFYPTPGTLSTAMYHSGLDPRSMRPVHVVKGPHEKAMQRALMQYRLPGNRKLVAEALKLAGRADLIGFGKTCLIRPGKPVAGQAAKWKAGPFKKEAPEPSGKPKKKKTIRNVHKPLKDRKR